ncbi:MAG: hypothetical protein WAL27_07295, partial [Cellulosimicrobium cellulans]
MPGPAAHLRALPRTFWPAARCLAPPLTFGPRRVPKRDRLHTQPGTVKAACASSLFTSAALLKDIPINRSAAAKALTLFTTLLLAGALAGCDAAAQAATQAASGIAEAVREAP